MGSLNGLKTIFGRKVFDLLLLLSLSAFTCRALFSLDKAFVAGTDLLGMHFWTEPYLWSRFRGWIYAWSPFTSCGHIANPPTPFFLLSGALALAAALVYGGFTTVVTKLIIFMLFPLASFSMYFLTYRLLKNRVGALVSALLYMYNQFFFSELVSEGHFHIALGYAITPLVFLTLENALRSSKIKDILILSIVSALFLSSAHHPVYIVGVFSLLYLLLWVIIPKTDRGRRVTTAVKVSFLAVSVCFLLSAYWLLPEVFCVRTSSMLFEVIHKIDSAYFFSYKSLLDALAIRNSVDNLGAQRILYWELPSLRGSYTSGLMLFVPLLAYAAMLICKDRVTIFCSLSAIVSCFLALGPHGFSSSTFTWLWTHVPGYSTFRVGGRFLMITCFAYAYLAGATVGRVHSKLSSFKVIKSGLARAKRLDRFWKYALRGLSDVFLLFTIIVIICYSWVGSIGGFHVYNWPKEYMEPYEWIRSQPGDFRVLSVPYGGAYVNYTWSSLGADLGSFSYGIHDKGVFTGANDYSSDYASFLGSLILFNSTDRLSSMLGVAGVRYVVLKPDASLHDHDVFSKQRNLVATSFNGDATILENIMWSSHIFSVRTSVLVIGGRNSFPSLAVIPGFNLNQSALFFAEQPYDQPNAFSVMNKVDTVIFSGGDILDLFFTLYSGSSSMEAYRYAFPSSNETEYWVRSNWWLGEGNLVLSRFTLRTSGENSVDIPFSVASDGVYDVWLRVAYAQDRGALKIKVDDNPIKEIKPYAVSWMFKWVSIKGHLTAGEHTLTLTNDGSGLNDVDKIVAYPSSRFQEDFDRLISGIQALESRLILVMEAEHMLIEHKLMGKETEWWLSPLWGCHASNGWTLMTDNPGTNVSTRIFVPREGRYALGLRVVAGPLYGNLTVQIDEDHTFVLPCKSSDLELVWREVGSFNLGMGNHTLKLISDDLRTLDVDEVVLYSLFDGEEGPLTQVFPAPDENIEISYEQINPTEYSVHVKTDKPFILCFGESYHPMWRAYVEGKELEPFLTYSFMNGFFIEKAGEFDVRIHFLGQNYVTLGGITSLTTFILIIAYFSYLRLPKITRKLRKSCGRGE